METNNVITTLTGHVSQDTAYLVTDYPYGFRLRCQKRYWIEWTKNGARLVEQTSNPKRAGLVWNAPKKSTYSDLKALYLDENGHVQSWGISLEWSDSDKWNGWLEKFGHTLPELPQIQALLNNAPIIFEARKHIKIEIRASKPIDIFGTSREEWDRLAKEEEIEKKKREEEKRHVIACAIGMAQKTVGAKLM